MSEVRTKVEAVVFDLDGLLLDSEQVWNSAKRRLAEECGGRWTAEADRAMLGMSSPEWSRYMHEELSVPLSKEEIAAGVVALMGELYREWLPLQQGAGDALARIAAEWPLGLASSSNREVIDIVLERTGWDDLIQVSVASEEVARGKPAPDVYLEAARRLGAAPEHCVAVEDSAPGIGSTHAAGMAVIAIPNQQFPPGAEALATAAVVLESLDGLQSAAVRRAAG